MSNADYGFIWLGYIYGHAPKQSACPGEKKVSMNELKKAKTICWTLVDDIIMDELHKQDMGRGAHELIGLTYLKDETGKFIAFSARWRKLETKDINKTKGVSAKSNSFQKVFQGSFRTNHC